MSKFTSISAEQIERFFEGRCTADEAAAITRYLQQNPDVFQYYVQREWREAATGADVNNNDSRKMYQEIQKQLKTNKQPGKLITLKRVTAVAAAVIVLAASIWLFKPIDKPATASLTETPVRTAPSHETLSIHSDKQERHQLPDGSSVILYANSTIRYVDTFEPNRRAIALEGKALFNVNKDETRPFIVTAGAIETTDLGTEFLVSETPDNIQVRLISGKIRLHNNEQQNKKDIILTPGDQLNYAGGITKVTRRQNEPQIEEPEEGETEPIIEENIAFDNTALPHVLDRLAASYHVQIKYNRQQISNMYFTGNVLTSDPLTTTLHIIATMNDLRIAPEKKGYSLRK